MDDQHASDGAAAGEAVEVHEYCFHGHPRTEKNTAWYLHTSGIMQRACRICHKDNQRKYRQRGRERLAAEKERARNGG